VHTANNTSILITGGLFAGDVYPQIRQRLIVMRFDKRVLFKIYFPILT
jgi:hypothetical protein